MVNKQYTLTLTSIYLFLMHINFINVQSTSKFKIVWNCIVLAVMRVFSFALN